MGVLREREALGRAPLNFPFFAGVAVEVGPQSVLGCRKTYVQRFKHYLILSTPHREVGGMKSLTGKFLVRSADGLFCLHCCSARA